jgi:hypothetical protein
MVFTGVTSAPQTLIDLDLVMPGPVIVGGPADNVQAASGDVMIAGPVADLTGGLLRSTIGQLRGELTHQVTHLGPVTIGVSLLRQAPPGASTAGADADAEHSRARRVAAGPGSYPFLRRGHSPARRRN